MFFLIVKHCNTFKNKKKQYTMSYFMRDTSPPFQWWLQHRAVLFFLCCACCYRKEYGVTAFRTTTSLYSPPSLLPRNPIGKRSTCYSSSMEHADHTDDKTIVAATTTTTILSSQSDNSLTPLQAQWMKIIMRAMLALHCCFRCRS